MFKIGDTYEFTFMATDENGTYYRDRETWTVQDVEGTLLKLFRPGVENTLMGKMDPRTKIVNIASPMFLEAEARPDLIKEIAKAMAED